MTRITVQPAEDYFVAFLATRGITLAENNAEVIHYFGESKRKIRKLVADHDPDLVIIHNQKAFFNGYKFAFVLDHVTNDREIYEPRTIHTNAPDLARLHYQSLGLQRGVHDINEDKKKKHKEKLQINSSVVKRFLHAMMWD